MKTIIPFAGLRPMAKFVGEVIAPPYDVLNRQQAYQLAHNKPFSFLHISKPEIDLPADLDPYHPRVYVRGMENFRQLLKHGILEKDHAPYYYIYRLTLGTHQQTGILAAVSVNAYQQGKIRKHELTQPAKELDRVRQIATLSAQTSPVLLTFRAENSLRNLLADCTESTPTYCVTAPDGVTHELWVIDQEPCIKKLSKLLNACPELYIADGHHRAAASLQIATKRNKTVKQGEKMHHYFLAGLFPDDELNILGYHRLVTDLNHLTTEEFLLAVGQFFVITPSDMAVLPATRQQFGCLIGKQWYQLQWRTDNKIAFISANDALDVNILYQYILQPILAIGDQRTDKRISYCGGREAIAQIEDEIHSERQAVAFTVAPTAITDMFVIADNHQIMPPKSTWFEPKLADGLVSFLLD